LKRSNTALKIIMLTPITKCKDNNLGGFSMSKYRIDEFRIVNGHRGLHKRYYLESETIDDAKAKAEADKEAETVSIEVMKVADN